MGLSAGKLRMSARDFINWDATQSHRPEVVCGEGHTMAGAGEAQVMGTCSAAHAVGGGATGTRVIQALLVGEYSSPGPETSAARPTSSGSTLPMVAASLLL